jgi:myosin heavy subunit
MYLFIDRDHDVALGKTKIFIRKPNTLALLENARTGKIPDLVIVVQVSLTCCFTHSLPP